MPRQLQPLQPLQPLQGQQSPVRTALIDLAERYFAAVDSMNVDRVLEFFHPDAVFLVPTFDARHSGRDRAIRTMFERLYSRYDRVWHGGFRHVVDAESGLIASRFRVENTAHDGQLMSKSNCNFFSVRDGRFDEVAVYMSGDNSLD